MPDSCFDAQVVPVFGIVPANRTKDSDDECSNQARYHLMALGSMATSCLNRWKVIYARCGWRQPLLRQFDLNGINFATWMELHALGSTPKSCGLYRWSGRFRSSAWIAHCFIDLKSRPLCRLFCPCSSHSVDIHRYADFLISTGSEVLSIATGGFQSATVHQSTWDALNNALFWLPNRQFRAIPSLMVSQRLRLLSQSNG